MRVLVLGAGATGGYFGGRLLENGSDVTFLVRPGRAEQLRRDGLVVESRLGDLKLDNPPLIVGMPDSTFDLIILSCKAFDQEAAIQAVTPAVGQNSAVLPLLNGLKHLELLQKRLGKERILGGYCAIAATLSVQGRIQHLNKNHILRFGELSKQPTQRLAKIAEMVRGANMDAAESADIIQDMWDKWIMLATLAGITCLMRSSVGAVVRSSGGPEIILQLIDECVSVSRAHGITPNEASMQRTLQMLADPDSKLTASMLRDVERGNRTEADHVLGDLIERAQAHKLDVPMLKVAYCHLKAYELQQAAL